MKHRATNMNQAVEDRDMRPLTELQKELYWVILRARERARYICEQAGYTPEEAGLEFLHPTMGARRNYTMICLRVE
ncbi:MAG: hypothetical protein WAR22_06770 [Desulfomonilia bacterium]|jgi:hypothetical protein